MKIRVAAFLLLSLLTVALAGCSSQEKPSRPKTAAGKPLLIGLIPEQNIFKQLERYQPLADYISGKLDRKVTLKVLPRYGNIIHNFRDGELDGAFFGSFTYALAHAKLGVHVVARPVTVDGQSTYHGLLFVRRDGGIRTIDDMKGKRFVFVDKATTAGYLLPLVFFQEHGVRSYKQYFRETYFAGTHEDAIEDVLNRKADIGAAKNTVYERLAKVEKRIGQDLVILAKSPVVPENGLAVRKELDPAIRNRLKEILLTMHEDPAGSRVLKDFGAQRFIETTEEDYLPVYEYASKARLNLKTYDYLND